MIRVTKCYEKNMENNYYAVCWGENDPTPIFEKGIEMNVLRSFAIRKDDLQNFIRLYPTVKISPLARD